MDKIDFVIKVLHSPEVNLADARVLFDAVIEKTPSTRVRLGDCSNSVEIIVFEIAVCKVQNGEENTLTVAEPKSLQQLLNLERRADANKMQSDNLDFAARFLKRCRLSAAPNKSRYMDLRFILATSNKRKRSFSAAEFGSIHSGRCTSSKYLVAAFSQCKLGILENR